MADSILDIKDILEEYSSDIQEAIIEDAEKVAKKGANELKNTSPKRTGKYAKGWRVYSTNGKGYTSNIIYNTNPGLTMLLERTHATRNGGSTTPKSAGHISKVEQKCIKEYEKDVENIIKNGG